MNKITSALRLTVVGLIILAASFATASEYASANGVAKDSAPDGWTAASRDEIRPAFDYQKAERAHRFVVSGADEAISRFLAPGAGSRVSRA